MLGIAWETSLCTARAIDDTRHAGCYSGGMDPLLSALRDHYPDDEIAAALTSSGSTNARNRALRRWETGEFAPSLATLRRLAHELNCELVLGPQGSDVRKMVPKIVTMSAVIGTPSELTQAVHALFSAGF